MIRAMSMVFGLSLVLAVGCGPAAQDQGGAASSDITTKEEQQALTPEGVMADLRAGNERFVAGTLTDRDYIAQMKATASGQYPKAAVLSCLDSRVPVEIVLDQGIGDLFVGDHHHRFALGIGHLDLLETLTESGIVEGGGATFLVSCFGNDRIEPR